MRRILPVSVLLLSLLALSLAPGLTHTAQAQTCNGTTHVVRTGENLFRISVQYGVSVDAIAANNGIINQDYIQVAQVLCIPPAGATGGPLPQNGTGTTDGAQNTVSGRVLVGTQQGFFVDRAANSPIYPVGGGTIDQNSGYTTTASVTLDPINNLLRVSGGGMIPNSQVRVYVSSALGDISGGIIGMLDTDANGSFDGYTEIPFISGATRQYVMVRAYDGRMTFGYFDLATRFPNFSQ